jgi:uncharacterized protein YdeI (YjbR/CyaY-like superfamily)
MRRKDPRVDDYIAQSADFAKPILRHLRKVVHAASPEVVETLKWGSPSFMHKGIVCGIAAFKEHCVFGFWKHALLSDRLAGLQRGDGEAMGQFGRITSVSQLPADRVLVRLVRAAVDLNERGVKSPKQSKPRGDRRVRVPGYFLTALRKNRKALATFEGFSYTNKKDYVDWVTEAKGEDTRRRRLETSVAWMIEGKTRNWKYIRK